MSLILEALSRQNTSASPGLRQSAPGQRNGPALAKQGWSTFYILLSVAVLAGMATTLGWLMSQRDAPIPAQVQAPSTSVGSESWRNLESPVSTSPQAEAHTHRRTPVRQESAPRDARPPADIPAPLLKMAKHIKEQEELIQTLETRLAAIIDNESTPYPYMQTAAFVDQPQPAPEVRDNPLSYYEGASQLHNTPRATPSLPHGSFVVQAKATDAPADEQSHENRIAERMQTFESAMTRTDWAAAERHLNDLSSLLPTDSLTLLRNKAWLLMNKGDNAKSMKLYTRILERLPNDLNAQLNLAILDQRLGNRPAAAKRLQRILDENPSQPDALAALDYLQALP